MNKIGFLTNYDESTSANFNIVKNALPSHSYNLLSINATRAKLLKLLTDYPEYDVFVFTHGNSDKFYGNDDLVAYSIQDNLLINRKVFIYACYTSNILGKKTASLNSIYWGYTGALAALEDNNLSKHIFVDIIADILRNFSTKNNEDEILEYLENLQQMCEEGAEKLDDIYEKNPNFDSMAGYKALNHIWSRLRVYFKSEHIVLRHPNAEIGDIFET